MKIYFQYRIAFRVDSSKFIGSGHLMRCLALAEELKLRKATIYFIVRPHIGNMNSVIRSRGFTQILLPFLTEVNYLKNSLLGVPWKTDAIQTLKVLQSFGGVQWLIVDHYNLDKNWEKLQYQYAKYILVIDDLANRKHKCDVLLDQNLVNNANKRYNTLVPSYCRLLLGLKFALISKAYSYWHKIAYNKKKEVKKNNIFVFFGSTDLTFEGIKFLEGWCSANLKDLKVNIIISENNSANQKKYTKFSNYSNIEILKYSNNIAKLMYCSVYSFGAAGTTSWERFCVGLNTTNVIIAENQRKIAIYLSQLDLTECLGDYKMTSPEVYAKALINLDVSSSKLIERRQRILEYVDGLGILRVVKILENFL